MEDYIITCESGIQALVSADSISDANEQWDADVDKGNAEPRIPGMTRLATEDEIQDCINEGHDYR